MNPLHMENREFRTLCDRVAAIAAEYLQQLDTRRIAVPERGAEIARIFDTPLPETAAKEEVLKALQDVVRYSRAQNGRFFGYILGSGEPAAAAADLLCSVLNQNVTAWRSAPAAVTLEHLVVGWLAEAIGCKGFSGTLTGGGSAANLMALAMAREAKAAANEAGISSASSLAVYASTEIHMSIGKALSLLGIGRKNLRLVPVDESFRMIPSQLQQTMARDADRGIAPIAVIASAGTVNTGAVDPMAEIAEIAKKFGAWFHVDGAYGALGAIAAPRKFVGLDLADSISLDPHKWLYQPIDCACLLYRNPAAARKTFSQSGDYVKALSGDATESYTFFDESMELSRRFRALKLWFSLRYHGLGAFRECIANDMRHAQQLAAAIQASPLFRLRAPVELSAVCFQYVGNGKLSDGELDEWNAAILRRVIERGRVYLSNATLHSRFCLRACFVNHRTSDADVGSICPEVIEAARETLGAPQS